jgi:hypothetical protein
MNCKLAHERIVMAAYDELADEQTRELELHLAGCPECREEQEQMLALKLLDEANPVLEPDANLLARSRQKLEEALDALPPSRWYHWLGQRMRNNFTSVLAAPLAAALLLVVGAGAGSMGAFVLAQNHAVRVPPPLASQAQPTTVAAVPAQTEIANVSSIVRKPNSERVEVRYNQVVPQRIEGSLGDPAIRQLLMLASENSASTGVRDDSVDLMAAECRAGHSCTAAGIRDALLVALRYDKSASVREKALHGLEPYVAEDVRVRDAILEALMNDGDPRIRTAAINILQPVEADTSVRQVLYSVSNTDRNPYIRTVSRKVLSNVPEIQ